MADERPPPPYQLNLGAAKTYIPGFVNIDIHERAELSLDLAADKLPFPDGSVRTVVSHHTLEHVPNYLFALGEIFRVLQHDGELLLSLPYVTSTEHHLVNPYHLHNFSERAFDFFDAALLRGSAAEDSDIAFRSVFVQLHYVGYFGIAPRPVRVWARRHLLNVVNAFDIALVAIKDPDRAIDTSAQRARELAARITQLKRERVPYAFDSEQAQVAPQRARVAHRPPAPARTSPWAGSSVRRALRRWRAARVVRSE